MGLIKKYYKLVSVLSVAVCIMAACTVSYKFNGASINYDKVKTISFENFPNRSAAFVWGPMESMFNTALQQAQKPERPLLGGLVPFLPDSVNNVQSQFP